MFEYSTEIDEFGIKRNIIHYNGKKAWYSYDPSLCKQDHKTDAERELRSVLGQQLGLNGYYNGLLGIG